MQSVIQYATSARGSNFVCLILIIVRNAMNRYECYKSQIDRLTVVMNEAMDNMLSFSTNDAIDFWKWYSNEYYCAGWMEESQEALNRIDANLIVKWHKDGQTGEVET